MIMTGSSATRTGATTAHPWIDPELAPGLDLTPPPLANLGDGPEGIPALRAMTAGALPTDDELALGGRLTVSTETVRSADEQHDIELIVLRPASGEGPRPAVYFVHPSGMVIPNHRLGLEKMAAWADRYGLTVVSVDYRLAPEHKGTTAVEDAYAGLLWTASNASSLDVDLDRLVLLGISGGGGVAAGTALVARDRGGPSISHQMLICPMLDDRGTTPSSWFEGIPWDGRANDTGWRALLGDAKGGAEVSDYAAPARATDLAGLPPTYIDVGAAEVFRDESIAYASALLAAGVPVELHVWIGAYHGYEGTAPTAEVSIATEEARQSFLRRALQLPRAD
jgi:acetyl esterase/lipase